MGVLCKTNMSAFEKGIIVLKVGLKKYLVFITLFFDSFGACFLFHHLSCTSHSVAYLHNLVIFIIPWSAVFYSLLFELLHTEKHNIHISFAFSVFFKEQKVTYIVPQSSHRMQTLWPIGYKLWCKLRQAFYVTQINFDHDLPTDNFRSTMWFVLRSVLV